MNFHVIRLYSCLLGLVAVAHVGADDSFPQPFDTELSSSRPLSADESAKQMLLPAGFQITTFASEPAVRQPIAMTTDARGRLWVAENYTYSERPTVFNDELRDRILIFEDSDNDGRFDKRTVFWEGAQRLMSIEVGSGGVWALCLPELVFIADRDGDDVPDGPPQAVLDGFVHQRGSHTVANGLRWGPDGWLYGRQGILATSQVGIPGTPEGQRTTVNVGIWRFSPSRQVFENVAIGTTNPWGMDWNSHGEMFFINTVIGHLWHVIPGAHYRRMSGGDLDPRIYDIIEQHADHVHWATGEVWTDVRKGVTEATLHAGGGHAHTGLLIYQGGEWPESWNGKLLTINYHGKRFNVERLERLGSGYVGRREPDAFLSADPWFRGLDLIPAPDGGIYLSDWSDAGECHDNDGVHRSSGRIFKIIYGDSTVPTTIDLSQLDDIELAKLQLSENDWQARMSRRVLVDRVSSGRDCTSIRSLLHNIVGQSNNTVHRLRALWTLHVTGDRDSELLTSLLSDGNENVRVWALRLLEEQSHDSDASRTTFLETAKQEFPFVAVNDASGLVRLTIASMLQKLPMQYRADIAGPLLSHADDESDHNQPLMLWYGILPLADVDDGRFERLIVESKLLRIQRYGARRLAEDLDTDPQRIDKLLRDVAERASPESVYAILDGITDGLSGRRKATKPASWDVVQAKLSATADEKTNSRLRDLSALFGDGRAIESLRETALDTTASPLQRGAALRTLIEARAPDLYTTCERLLDDSELTLTAANGLALSDDLGIADKLLATWPRLDGQAKNPMLNILISRPTWVNKVLDAVAEGRVERERLGAFQVRQIRAYKSPEISQRLDAILGQSSTPIAGTNAEMISRWKQRLTNEVLSGADKANGRVVFQTSCAVCHRLNGEGSNIGPDLTGAARENLNYLLENILAPSASLADEYRQVTVLLADGRVLVGTAKPGANNTLKLQTTSELLTLSKDEIEEQSVAPISMMPEGLLDVLDEARARDLIAYLMTK